MGFTELERLQLLHKKLKQFSTYKRENRLDFMEWEKYPRQNSARELILGRYRTKQGYSIIPIFGSNRSGKSELGGGVVAQIFAESQNARGWCATESDLSVKVQQRKLASTLRKSDIEYGTYNAVRGWKNRTIISKKNTVIYLKTYDQGAESFQGDDIDFAWFDEEPPWDVFSETLVRLADRNGFILLTFTSLNGFTKIVNFLWESNNKNVAPGIILVAKENPFLSEESKKQLFENIDPDELESRWEGRPHIKQGLIYKQYLPSLHRIKRFDYLNLVKNAPQNWILHEGIDPHERTPHHWLRLLYDRQNDINYVVEELKAPSESMLISDFSRLIKAARGGVLPQYTQIDTSSMKPDVIVKQPDEYQEDAHNVRSEFARNGIETILVTKDNAIGIGEVKRRLKQVVSADGTVKKKPTLYIFDDLSGVHWEFTRYSWDSFASTKIAEKREQVNTPFKKDDHFMDILKYDCIKLKGDYGLKDESDPGFEEQFAGTGY